MLAVEARILAGSACCVAGDASKNGNVQKLDIAISSVKKLIG